MKKLLLGFIASIAICAGVSAQTSVIRGTVLDGATNMPLTGAVIMVDSTYHSIADAKGMFSVENVPYKASSEVSVNFIGYKQVKASVKIGSSVTNMGTVTMFEEAIDQGTAIIQGEVLIAIQKGDTTQYNAAAFKTNPDAYTGDLLNKMPGMVVEENSITVQGESVQRVYVDGKLTFGDDPMAALNNLPADAVESIQVFDELSDDAKFTGYNDGKLNRALNIVTKNKNQKTIDATLEAGYGGELEKNMYNEYQERYLLSGRVNVFTPNERYVVNATTNNNNSSSGRMGGNSGGFGGGGGLRTITSFNANYSREWVNKLRFNAGYSFNKNESETATRRLQNYFPTSSFESKIYADTNSSKNENYSNNINMRVEYTLNKNNKFNFTPRISFGSGNSNGIRHVQNYMLYAAGDEQTTRTNISTLGDNDNYNIGGNLAWLRNLGKAGRTFSLSTNLNFSNNDANNLQIDTDPGSTQPMNTEILTTGYNRSVSTMARYSEPLSASTTISANYTLSYTDSKTDKQSYDMLSGMPVLDEALTNIYTRNYTTNNAGVGYSYFKGNIRINANVGYEAASLNKDQEMPVTAMPKSSYTFSNILPSFTFRFMKDRKRIFNLSYNTSVNLPSVEQLQNVVNNNNPIQLSAGNPNLEESYSHNFNANYSSTNSITSFSLSAGASVTQNSITTRTTYFRDETILADYNDYVAQRGSQLSTPVNVNGQYNFRTNASYSFPIQKIRSKLNSSLGYNFRHMPFYSGSDLYSSNANEVDLRIGLVSNISENVDFTFRTNTGYSYATNPTKSNTNYLSESLSGQLNIIFLGGFVFNTDLSYNIRRNFSSETGTDQTYTLWNAGVGRKFGKFRQAEFRVTMYDILKQSISYTHSINNNYIQDSWTNTMGRYVMGTFTYRFNSLRQNQQNRENVRRNEGGFEGGDFQVPEEVQQRMRERGVNMEDVQQMRGQGGGNAGGGFGGGGRGGSGGGGGRGGF